MNSRRRAATGLLVLGVLLLGLAGVLWSQYLRTRQVPSLPVIPVVEVLGLAQPIYSFSIYGVEQPLGVAVSRDGERIYVAEGGGDRFVRFFDPRGNQLGSIAPPATTKASRKPVYVAVSPEGLVYVSDLLRGTIDVYSPEGEFQKSLKPVGGSEERWQPLAMTFDSEGNLYFTDVGSSQHRVLVMDRSGAIVRQITGDLAYPNGVVVDGQGRTFVADSGNGLVKVFDREGQLIGEIVQAADAKPMGLPRGLALDWGGRLVVVDTLDHSVSFFSAGTAPKFQFRLGQYGNGDGEFRYPSGLAISQGRVYVTDRENNRVQVWF